MRCIQWSSERARIVSNKYCPRLMLFHVVFYSLSLSKAPNSIDIEFFRIYYWFQFLKIYNTEVGGGGDLVSRPPSPRLLAQEVSAIFHFITIWLDALWICFPIKEISLKAPPPFDPQQENFKWTWKQCGGGGNLKVPYHYVLQKFWLRFPDTGLLHRSH